MFLSLQDLQDIWGCAGGSARLFSLPLLLSFESSIGDHQGMEQRDLAREPGEI